MTAGESGSEPFLSVWNNFVDGLRDLAPAMLDKLPERLREDQQTQHEIGRLMLETLGARILDAVGADGDHPLFLPALNVVLNVHQPNADTAYKTAQITPGGSYRLRGRVGSMRIAKIGALGSPAANGTVQAITYYDLNTLTTDQDGAFDVLFSPIKPHDYEGDWWQLDPGAPMLLLRQVAYDWRSETDAVLSIERTDVAPTRHRPALVELERRLRELPSATAQAAMLLVDHGEQLRREGFVNTFKVWDVVAEYGGLFGQFYYECFFDLQDDEALIIESDYPETLTYASLILTNQIFETIDWYNNHSSLNGAQWKLNSDGKLRVVVSAIDPGVHNWLDTAGYPTGVVQGRWLESSSTPMPTARKVKLKDVSDHLPGDTPTVTLEERDRIIRERRAHLQQRVLW
jgi:hypothetical protein